MVLPSKVAPLAWNVPIVDEQGNPTPYFMRQLERLLSEKAITDGLADGAVQDSDLVEILEALEIDDLADVDTTTTAPTEGQSLTWNNTSQLWVPKSIGSGGSAPTVRASKIQSSSASSYALTWPTGTAAGDIVFIMGGHGFAFNNPSGWLVLNNSSGTNWSGAAWAKQMTAADITAGGVTITTTGSFNGVIAQLTTTGVTGKIRETDVLRDGAGGSPRSVSTSWTPVTNDLVICFGSNRNNDSPTCDFGSQLQQIAAASASGVLNSGVPGSNGAINVSFTYPTTSGTTGDYQVVIVVQAAGT